MIEGFETGRWTHQCRVFPTNAEPYNDEIGNIFTPENWTCFFKHEPGVYDQPEAHNVWKSGDARRIHSGKGAYLLFSFYRKHDAGIMRQIDTKPGDTLTLTAWMHAWSNTNLPGHNDCLDNGKCSCGVGTDVVAIKQENAPPLNGNPWNDAVSNFLVMVGIDPMGGDSPYADTVIWGDAYYIYNGYAKQLNVETIAQSNIATVFVRSVTAYPFKHNDLYIDDVVLTTSGGDECWGKPRVPYTRTYVLLPQGYGVEWAEAAARGGEKDKLTVGYSADDAGIGMLENKTVIAVNPDEYSNDLEDFYKTYYPRTTYQPLEAASPAELEQKLKGDPVPDALLLWQGDPAWKNTSFGGECDLTIGQAGCFICCAGMAQKYYGVDKQATPVSVDTAVGPDGYAGCMLKWSAMKQHLGIEIVKKTYDQAEADAWLASGEVAFAEVMPTTLEHFVFVVDTEHKMYDPYKNLVGKLEDHYIGAESWRLVRKTHISPPLGNLVGLHLQSMVSGAIDYVSNKKPTVMKIFQLENAQAIKAANPDTLVVLRYFTENQNTSGDLKTRAREYVESFRDSLEVNAEWIDYVESYNELIATHDIEGIKRSVEFDYHFADELIALGLPVAPGLLTAAVGNPYHEGGEIELMLPAVEQAVKYNGILCYHNYFWADPTSGGPDADWKYFAGRALEGWDPIFRSHGLYPKYIFTESGAVGRLPNGALLPCDGWKSNLCCCNDWGRYKSQIERLSEKIKAWNALHDNRCLGFTIFTSGGFSWPSFEFTTNEFNTL